MRLTIPILEDVVCFAQCAILTLCNLSKWYNVKVRIHKIQIPTQIQSRYKYFEEAHILSFLSHAVTVRVPHWNIHAYINKHYTTMALHTYRWLAIHLWIQRSHFNSIRYAIHQFVACNATSYCIDDTFLYSFQILSRYSNISPTSRFNNSVFNIVRAVLLRNNCGGAYHLKEPNAVQNDVLFCWFVLLLTSWFCFASSFSFHIP